LNYGLVCTSCHHPKQRTAPGLAQP
jgi:hypothetical protein